MNDIPLYARIHKFLNGQQAAGRLRRLAEPAKEKITDLSSNSYLALNNNPAVLSAARELAQGDYAGNCASRLITTRSALYPVLESFIADWQATECALVFNSGYCANLGVLQALCTPETEVFCDRLNHASIVDGIMLSRGRLIRYRHGDMDDLKARLKLSESKDKIIATDTVFSMDGDRAPLADICELARSNKCAVMIDEAHATGVLGKEGSGLAHECGVAGEIDIHIGTLSKAVAGMGGYFAGSALMRDYLVNRARSLIYSTALPHSVIAFDLAALRFIRMHPEFGPRLLSRAEILRNELRSLGFSVLESTTQIIPCVLGSENAALDCSAFLRHTGIVVPAIRPPTVPAGTARLRFSVHSGLTDDNIAALIGAMKEWKTAHA
ncbi:MAG: 8-amino-7-oxononanoate synthase [Chitinivibrionales bacterium]|nr:8-amino-7-oxononanoate synthase [Chitinivibrionales bacterium]